VVAVLGLYVWFWGSPVGVNNYVNKVSLQMLFRSPELLTSIGAVDNSPLDFHSDKLGDYDKQSELEMLEFMRQSRAGLDDYGPEGLEGQELLSWKIVAWFYDDIIRQSEFEYGGYRVNQISGPMVNLPQFLTDSHIIKDEKSFQRYISRLYEFARVIAEVKVQVVNDRNNGTVPPDFVIEKALMGMRSFSEEGAQANPLITTLVDKLKDVEDITEERKAELSKQAAEVVESEILPQYAEMIGLFEELLTISNHDAGIWRLPHGEDIDRAALRSFIT
jgi:uncharacterized protein (DUF885 family)